MFAEGTSQASQGTKNKQTSFSQKFRKYHDSSLDADDTESELVAIPESDQSDSTLHGGSAPVSGKRFFVVFCGQTMIKVLSQGFVR